MAFGDPYVTLTGLKSWLKIPLLDTIDDLELEAALTAASGAIDLATERQFNRDTTESPAATARQYRPQSRYLTLIDDLFSTEDLVIRHNGTTLDAAQYVLEPVNGVYGGTPGWPLWKFRPLGLLALDVDSYSLEVETPYWGWENVPAGVAQGSKILAADLFKMKDAPMGVAGFGELGVVRVRENNTVAALVKPYRRNPIKVR